VLGEKERGDWRKREKEIVVKRVENI